MTLISKFLSSGAVGALVLATGVGAAAQSLEIATDASPVGLDPHVATAFSTILVNGPIYEGLTGIAADLSVIPVLAEDWSVSDDGLTLTFDLRDGVTFHDGSAMTAEDVIGSIERVLDPETGSPYASRIAAIGGLEAPDDDTVVMTLTQPSAALLSQLAYVRIVPSDLAEDVDLQRQPVGTGPFAFAEWVPDTYIGLTAFDGYWEDGLPLVEGIRFNIVPEASTRQVGLSTGTYHMLPNVDSATALTLQGTPGVALLETADLAYSLIGMNVSEPPFDDPAMRRAVNTAIDRDQLVQAVYFGQGQPGGPLSPSLENWALPVSDFDCYSGGAEAAQAILAEAGYAEPVAFTIKALGTVQTVVDAAQVVQAQLNAAGFDVTLEVQEQGTFVQDWRNSNFQAFASLNGGNPDPDGYLYRTFRTGGSTNVFLYSNEEVDALLDEGQAETDMDARYDIYADLQRMLACEGPIAHLAYGTLYTAVSDTVTGYEMVGDRSTSYLRQTGLE
ncbi:MAG: ABC transporter substrate-binding protein [Azospirillaceae bacterium]